jgi:serine/threonine protein kinase
MYGLIPLLLANTEAKRPYYVMPYLQGGSLAQYAGHLTDVQLLVVATELARTLAGLHARRDVHGDVKPDNLLLTRDGQLRVADPLGNGALFTCCFREIAAVRRDTGRPRCAPADRSRVMGTSTHMQRHSTI